jgi:hypothetical protein
MKKIILLIIFFSLNSSSQKIDVFLNFLKKHPKKISLTIASCVTLYLKTTANNYEFYCKRIGGIHDDCIWLLRKKY